MGYPVPAYRGGQRNGGSALKEFGIPKLPFPANDPRGRPGRTPVPRIPRVPRLPFPNPYVRAFQLGWDLGDALYDWYYSPAVAAVPGGWDLTGWAPKCDNGKAKAVYVALNLDCVGNATWRQSWENKSLISPPQEVITFMNARILAQGGQDPIYTGAESAVYVRAYDKNNPKPLPEFIEGTEGQPAKWNPPALPRPAPGPREAGNTVPSSPQKPSVVPGSSWVVSSSGVTQSNARHRRKPPGPGVREKKGGASLAVMQVLQKVFHGITEFGDYVDSLYDAIPAKYRLKYRNGQIISVADKALHVWQNLDKVDINDAVKNLIKNAIEDAVAGRAESLNKWKHPDGVSREAMTTPYGAQGSPAEAAAALVNEVFKRLGV